MSITAVHVVTTLTPSTQPPFTIEVKQTHFFRTSSIVVDVVTTPDTFLHIYCTHKRSILLFYIALQVQTSPHTFLHTHHRHTANILVPQLLLYKPHTYTVTINMKQRYCTSLIGLQQVTTSHTRLQTHHRSEANKLFLYFHYCYTSGTNTSYSSTHSLQDIRQRHIFLVS